MPTLHGLPLREDRSRRPGNDKVSSFESSGRGRLAASAEDGGARICRDCDRARSAEAATLLLTIIACSADSSADTCCGADAISV